MAPKKKRKYSSSVATAARDALYSSSSDSSEEEDSESDDDESEQPSSSSEEDEQPIRKKKKVVHHLSLIPQGDKVYSAWWKDEKRSGETQWYPGSIKSYTQEETNSPYGPTRYYDIDFDDGDELNDVEDYYVFPETDYILQQKNDFKPNWIGVKNVTDKSVKGDRWPGDVGWYVATLGDGKESEHARLSDAMDAYDNHIVQTKGKKTKKSELNRPKKWGWLFATSDSESEGDNIKKKKRKRSKKKKKKKEEEPSIRKKVKSAFEAMAQSSVPPPPPKIKEKSSKSPSPTKGLKTPSSNYKGVSYSKQDKKYLALIEYGGKLHSLGYYKLESDAALAYDKGSIVLLSDADSPNFSTRQAYEKAIQREAEEETDPSLDTEESYKDVVKKVEVYLSNIYAGKKKTRDMDLEENEGSEEDSDENRSDEEASDDEEESDPIIKKKKGSSVYNGVSYHKSTKKWLSQIRHDGKRPNLGEYKLQADAALAYDEAVKLLGGSIAETNFATLEKYDKAKKDELARTGISNDVAKSPAAIKSKMTEIVRKTWPTFESSTFKKFERKKSTSDYVGVSIYKQTMKWRSSISHGSKQQGLGTYDLEVDAALAFDEGAKLLRGPSAETNFDTLKEYDKAKKDELEKTGLGGDVSMSPTAIKAKVTKAVRKTWPVASIQDSGSSKREFVNTDKQQSAGTFKKKTSVYTGVSYNKQNSKWVTRIKHDQKSPSFGCYTLEVEAALAYDETVKLLRGSYAETNFDTLEDYEKAKKLELEKTGLGSDASMSSAAIKAKVTDIVRKTWSATSIHDGGSSKRESVDTEKQQEDRASKKKTSNYVGVSYHKSTKKWVSQITHNNGTIKLGFFKLQADAAFAFDEAVKQLRGSTAKTNFSSLDDYERAKKQELIETGLGNDAAKSSAAIISEVLEALPLKYRASSSKKVSSSKKQPSGNRTLPAHQQSKHSKYIGVTYNNITQAFESEIKHGRRTHHIGHWHLQSDAALAYDEACKLLNGEDCSGVNFASDQSYLDARSNEISKLFGSSVTIEPISSITTEIKRQLAKIPSPELDALNDAMAAKWSRYLPSVTGNGFMALYQQSMGKLLGMTKSHQSEQLDTSTSIVSGNVGTDSAKDTVVPDGVFKPISDSGQKNTKSSQSQPEVDESDDEASLFSGNDTEGEVVDAVVNTSDKVEAGLQSVQNDNAASSSTTKHKEPNAIKEFPIGCPVMWNMNDNSFNCGIVSSKLTKGKQYEVVDKEKSSSKLVPGGSLLFGIDCPVFVAPSCDKDKTPLLQGKVLMYTRKAYTILINKEGNQMQVMTGVTQDRVTFRRVEKVDSSTPPNKIASASELNDTQKEKAPSQQPQPEKPRWQAPPSHKKSVEDNDNSTITSLDSAQVSSQRQLNAGRIPRKQGDNVDNVDCRIYFPHWLLPDNVSRQRLFSHLVDASNVMNLQQIGMKTNCTLRIIEGVTTGNPHVLIMSSLTNRKYAIDDVRKAANDLESALLEYIRHDGSQGRLFYDLAWKCKLLHPRGGIHSTVVQQRNPFIQDMEMGWVNIVQLPSIGHGSHKQYHHAFMFPLLKQINLETSCMIKICSNGARLRTNLCAPYVFVVGKSPGQVDRALEILQESIQHHMRVCGCRL